MTDTFQALITRLPYASRYRAAPILEQAKLVDERGLICLAMPLHTESPNNGGRLICDLEDAGLFLCAKVAWYRDRHIVMSKSKRLTNTWEPIAIFSKSKTPVFVRESATKIKKGYDTKIEAFDEDEYQTCIGDHWPVRNDRRDRRFLPLGVVMNCGQLAGLHPGDRVLDPYGNPGVKDSVAALGWVYYDGGLTNPARTAKATKKDKESDDEDEDLSGDTGDTKEDLGSNQGAFGNR